MKMIVKRDSETGNEVREGILKRVNEQQAQTLRGEE